MNEIISRDEALRLGLRRYFTGELCARGHVSERRVDSYSCIRCWNDSRNANRAANRQAVRDQNNAYLAKNRHRQKAWFAKFYEKNKEQQRERVSAYSKANRLRVTARILEKRATDIQERLRHRLRERMRSALKGAKRPGSARECGCTTTELAQHIERQFEPGMSWENWGNKRGHWTVDHIRPLTAFDLTDREQWLAACHYTNLRPMWMEENIKKGGYSAAGYIVRAASSP